MKKVIYRRRGRRGEKKTGASRRYEIGGEK